MSDGENKSQEGASLSDARASNSMDLAGKKHAQKERMLEISASELGELREKAGKAREYFWIMLLCLALWIVTAVLYGIKLDETDPGIHRFDFKDPQQLEGPQKR